jgi:hypothetical protein
MQEIISNDCVLGRVDLLDSPFIKLNLDRQENSKTNVYITKVLFFIFISYYMRK